MAATFYKASAPGNVMLLGEYAVTCGHPALVAAINKNASVTLHPNNDSTINITSQLGTHNCSIDNIKVIAPFEYVLTAIKQFNLQQGFTLNIESEIESGIGLSSSAAVTVAALKALYEFTEQTVNQETLLKKGIDIIRSVQGNGSGADVAASIYGGVILYQNHCVLSQLDKQPPLFIVYSGDKKVTAEAVQDFKRKTIADSFFEISAQLVDDAIDCINQENWQQLGVLFNQGQQLLQTLGVSTKVLDRLVTTCQQQPRVYGAKISGSGFGDCIIGLGELNNTALTNLGNGIRRINADIAMMEAIK